MLRGCLWEIGHRKKVERQLYTDRRKLAENLADVWHLYLLGGHLLATLDLAPVLEEILAAVTSLQGAELGAIRILDRDRGELETVVSLGLPPAYLERFGRMPDRRRGVRPGRPAGRAGDRRGCRVRPVGRRELAEPARLGGFRGVLQRPAGHPPRRRWSARSPPSSAIRTARRSGSSTWSSSTSSRPPTPWTTPGVTWPSASRTAARRSSSPRWPTSCATPWPRSRPPPSCSGPTPSTTAMLGEVRDMIVRQAGHMARLVEDLLDATRISRGTIALRKEPVDLAAVVARAVEDVRPLVEARAHELVVSLPAEPLILHADPTRLEQVLANLLTNAAKYTDPGGRIDLVAVREGERAGRPGARHRHRPDARGPLRPLRPVHPGRRGRTTGAAAAWGSGWRWSRAWWSCTAARSRPAATGRAPAASSPSGCPSAHRARSAPESFYHDFIDQRSGSCHPATSQSRAVLSSAREKTV